MKNRQHDNSLPEDDIGEFDEDIKNVVPPPNDLSVSKVIDPPLNYEEAKVRIHNRRSSASNYRLNNKSSQKRPQSVIRISNKPIYNINTSMLLFELDKEMVNTSTLNKKSTGTKIEKELDELKKKNQGLKRDIEMAKSDRVSLIKEIGKLENEVNQMLKSKELVYSCCLM